jgi:hypothetical protein
MAVEDGDVIRAVVEMVMDDGSIVQNVFWYLANFIANQSNATVLGALNGAIETFYSEVVGFIADSITYNPFSAQTMTWNETDQSWQVSTDLGQTSWDEPNTSIDEPFPNQMAAVVVAPTLRPKVRGRKFLPGFTENTGNAGILSAAAQTALGLFGAGYVDDVEIDVDNILQPGAASTIDGAFRPFQSYVVNSIMGTQRRRKPGVGA